MRRTQQRNTNLGAYTTIRQTNLPNVMPIAAIVGNGDAKAEFADVDPTLGRSLEPGLIPSSVFCNRPS